MFRFSSLLLLSLVAFLLCHHVTGFNPYSDDDETAAGSIPSTSTVTCTQDPVTGVEKCESVSKIVPDEEELLEKIEAAEAEREAIAAEKARARAEREQQYQAEREEKRAKRRAEQERKKKESEDKKKGPSKDDYKIKEPLKKLKKNYYAYFGVEPDAGVLKIRKAANAMSVANHPDKCPTQKCRDEMVIINQARDVLLNEETREQYDFLLRFGFKIYDKELYEDMLQQYKEDPDNMPTDFDEVFDPESDFSTMNLTEESAGWLLLLTGSITLAFMIWPIVKFWEKNQSSEAKRAAQKQVLLQNQQKAKVELGSLKKKTEKYTGERVAKRFDPTSPTNKNGPNTTPGAASSPRSSPITTATTLLCLLALISFISPIVAARSMSFDQVPELTITYYDLLEVATGVEAGPLKKA